MKHIGQALKDVIESNNMTKNKVAIDAGITPTYLSRLFGKESIDCKLLDNLCKAIGIKSSYFFDDDSKAIINKVENVQAHAVIGASVTITQGEADSLRALLEEKERTIHILMSAKGFENEK